LADSPSRRQERRRFARIDLSLSASVSVSEQSWTARCLNLSAGGALLRLDSERQLPETFLLHLVLPVLGDLPVPIIARRIEVLRCRVRLAFDPLPGPLAKAVASQLLAQVKPMKRKLALLN
jgi:c-di-GMP-binding flagellar brake protein YcgR